MLPLKTLTIVRSGRLTFRVTGPNHCGPADQTRAVLTPKGRVSVLDADYRLIVECAPNLDRRGFLFNQLSVQVFAQNLANRSAYASCEHLCIDLGVKFQTKIAEDVPTCQVLALTVELSPAPYKATLRARFEGVEL